MLDRKVPRVPGEIDIHVEVSRLDYEKLSSDGLGETSARKRQRVRFEGPTLSVPCRNRDIIPCRNRDYHISEMRVAEVR